MNIQKIMLHISKKNRGFRGKRLVRYLHGLWKNTAEVIEGYN